VTPPSGLITALTDTTVTIGGESVAYSPVLRDYLALCQKRGLPVWTMLRDGVICRAGPKDEFLGRAS
jgi:hypothetical protein